MKIDILNFFWFFWTWWELTESIPQDLEAEGIWILLHCRSLRALLGPEAELRPGRVRDAEPLASPRSTGAAFWWWAPQAVFASPVSTENRLL